MAVGLAGRHRALLEVMDNYEHCLAAGSAPQGRAVPRSVGSLTRTSASADEALRELRMLCATRGRLVNLALQQPHLAKHAGHERGIARSTLRVLAGGRTM